MVRSISPPNFRLLTGLGVLKTYRLTFESVAPMHALFIKESANNSWSISSKTLREFVEHFGPGTEQLDIYSEDSRVSFTSYTEKIMSGNGLLQGPDTILPAD
jgi:cell cycle checkpoint control protein RAD9A